SELAGGEQQNVAQVQRAEIDTLAVQMADEARQCRQLLFEPRVALVQQLLEGLSRQRRVKTGAQPLVPVQPECLADPRRRDTPGTQSLGIPEKAPGGRPQP